MFRCYAWLAVLICWPGLAQDSPRELLQKMQQALGGAGRMNAIDAFEQSVTAQTWINGGQSLGEVRKRVRWVKPDCLRLDQTGPYDTYVLYFDGTSGWEIMPDKRFIVLAGGELAFAQKYLSDFVLKVWLADRIPGYTITSPARNVLRIGVQNKANEQIDIALDPVSWLPAKQTSVSLADPNHPVPSETRFEEWTTVQGVRFPSRVIVLHNGVRLADIRTESIDINRGLTCAALAKRPAGDSPEMGRK